MIKKKHDKKHRHQPKNTNFSVLYNELAGMAHKQDLGKQAELPLLALGLAIEVRHKSALAFAKSFRENSYGRRLNDTLMMRGRVDLESAVQKFLHDAVYKDAETAWRHWLENRKASGLPKFLIKR
ncbi:MAG TPA: hypothetical protein VIN59_05120 [Alphaproteobacteria bacterium]